MPEIYIDEPEATVSLILTDIDLLDALYLAFTRPFSVYTPNPNDDAGAYSSGIVAIIYVYPAENCFFVTIPHLNIANLKPGIIRMFADEESPFTLFVVLNAGVTSILFSPRLVRAADAVLAPVPPSAIDSGVPSSSIKYTAPFPVEGVPVGSAVP